MSQVCVDANLVLQLILADQYSETVRSLWQEWIEQDMERVAPALFDFECVSATRLDVTRKLLTLPEAEKAFQDLLGYLSEVQLLQTDELYPHAWRIARELNQSQVYDAFYIALAEILNFDFWTAGEKLYLSSHRLYPRVKHIRSARRK